MTFSIRQCIHYGGTQVCRKGIDRAMVADNAGRIPCVEVRGITGQCGCDQRVMPEEPPRGEQGRASKMLAEVLAGLCPTCHVEITGELEFNGAVLALPCRHVRRSARNE